MLSVGGGVGVWVKEWLYSSRAVIGHHVSVVLDPYFALVQPRGSGCSTGLTCPQTDTP